MSIGTYTIPTFTLPDTSALDDITVGDDEWVNAYTDEVARYVTNRERAAAAWRQSQDDAVIHAFLTAHPAF